LDDEPTNIGVRPPLPPPPVARAARKATLPGQAPPPPPPVQLDSFADSLAGDDLLDTPTRSREPGFTQRPTMAGPLDFQPPADEDASGLLMEIGRQAGDDFGELDEERSSLMMELGDDAFGRDSVPMGAESHTDVELELGSQATATLRAALDEEVDTVTGAVAVAPAAPTVPQAPLLLDVTPLSLGVETVDGYCERIIRRNSAIPAGQTKMFTTARDRQETVVVRICQGEHRKVSANQLLGEVVLDGLRPAARGKVQIAVRFMIDADGTLQVRAQDVGTGQQQQIAIKLIGELPEEQIERLRERHEAKLGG